MCISLRILCQRLQQIVRKNYREFLQNFHRYTNRYSKGVVLRYSTQRSHGLLRVITDVLRPVSHSGELFTYPLTLSYDI